MPMPGRAILNIRQRVSAGGQNAPEGAAKLDLLTWEERSEGLIFFDSAGNWTGCSAKMQKLAGSLDTLRVALAGHSWPRSFAASGEPVAIFRDVIPFGPEPK